MEKLLVVALLFGIPMAQCCDPVDCNKLCKTGEGKLDLKTCKCDCYILVDDILMPVSLWDWIQGGGTGKAITTVYKRWNDRTDDGFVRVPFTLTDDIAASDSLKNSIIAGFGVLNAITCLKFEPAKSDDTDYIEIYMGSGCSSFIGRNGGKQRLSLAAGCTPVGTVQHEAMHALGIWHEHSRSDRDSYVNIVMDNVKTANRHNFYKKPSDETTSFSSPYDVTSVMHYGPTSFTVNGEDTIVRLDGKELVRQRKCPSHEDQIQINAMHSCNGKRGIPETTDCYHPLDRGFSYRGTQATTKSGKTCQAWSAQSPWIHSYKPEDVTGAGLESNYCRNPDADAVGPWCFTTDGAVVWEECDIPTCANAVPALSLTRSVEGTWNNWGEYSECNKPCGNGKKLRIRTCSTDICPTGRPFEMTSCNNEDCSTAVWGPFGAWSGCFCKKRKKYAIRQCLGGVINEGACKGKPWKLSSCTCSGSTGTWNAWEEDYSSCNKKCGNGKKLRVKTCSTNNCPTGKPYQLTKCTNGACSSGITWDAYSEWSGCYCKKGQRYRIRQCNGGYINDGRCKGKAWQNGACSCS